MAIPAIKGLKILHIMFCVSLIQLSEDRPHVTHRSMKVATRHIRGSEGDSNNKIETMPFPHNHFFSLPRFDPTDLFGFDNKISTCRSCFQQTRPSKVSSSPTSRFDVTNLQWLH